jgi:hypothetical protein
LNSMIRTYDRRHSCDRMWKSKMLISVAMVSVLIMMTKVELLATAFVCPIIRTVPEQQHVPYNRFNKYSPSSCAVRMVQTEIESEVEMRSSGERSIDVEGLRRLDSCQTGSAARRILEGAIPNAEESSVSNGRYYKSIQIPAGASELAVADADLALQTGIRNSKYSIMELIELNGDRDADRASLAIFCLTVASSASAIVANQSLFGTIPEILRFVVVWALSFAPLAFVGYGLQTPAELQALLVSIQRNLFPTYRQRMLQHEAGHFLMGHLLGLPIQGYTANAVKNAVTFYPLSDKDVGQTRASLLGFDRSNDDHDDHDQEGYSPSDVGSFFSGKGTGANILLEQSVYRDDANDEKKKRYEQFLKLPSKDDPTKAWPYRKFDAATTDKLAAVAVAGVCAEILAFGNAEGGYADFSLLKQLLSASTSNKDDEPLTEKQMENKIRYALGFTMGQLRRNLGLLDDLVSAMERNADVSECVLAIESCLNPAGAVTDKKSLLVVGDANYERLRRQNIQTKGVGFIERLFLGAGKNVDSQDNSVIEGKGGGDRKPKFAQMTGDDPLYFAIASAGIFFIWASTGGLSLH